MFLYSFVNEIIKILYRQSYLFYLRQFRVGGHRELVEFRDLSPLEGREKNGVKKWKSTFYLSTTHECYSASMTQVILCIYLVSHVSMADCYKLMRSENKLFTFEINGSVFHLRNIIPTIIQNGAMVLQSSQGLNDRLARLFWIFKIKHTITF